MNNDFYHRLLYALARQAKLHCRPNPAVVAGIFHKNRCISWGITQPVGHAHAEMVALNALRERVGEQKWNSILHSDQTYLVASLAPCHFAGRTQACTHQLVSTGLQKIVVAHDDSHPLVQKKSLDYLKKQGFDIQNTFSPALKKKFLWLNYDYLLQRSPTFTLKYAMTADGKMATHTKDSRWITGEQARKDARYERSCHDAVMIGAGTLFADDPRLDMRDFAGRKSLDWEMILQDAEIPPNFIHNDFVDEKDQLMSDIKLFLQQKNDLSIFSQNVAHSPQKPFCRIIFFSRDIVPGQEKKLLQSTLLQKKNRQTGSIIFLTSEKHERLNRWLDDHFQGEKDLSCQHYSPAILDDLALQKKFFLDFCRKCKIDSLFIEGGSRLLSMFFMAGLCDKLLVYLAPKLLVDGLGGLSPFLHQQPFKKSMQQAQNLKLLNFSRVGEDVKLGYVRENAEYQKLSNLLNF